jgi:hypothetical protein
MLEGREWVKAEEASSAAIDMLANAAPVTLPSNLLNLLRFTNGGEGPLPVPPLWFILYPAEEMAQIERDGTFKEFFPGFFVIGGNGGGDAIALDFRSTTDSPVVSFDMTNIDLEESVCPIASNFDAFLELIGRDET